MSVRWNYECEKRVKRAREETEDAHNRIPCLQWKLENTPLGLFYFFNENNCFDFSYLISIKFGVQYSLDYESRIDSGQKCIWSFITFLLLYIVLQQAIETSTNTTHAMFAHSGIIFSCFNILFPVPVVLFGLISWMINLCLSSLIIVV